MSTLKEILLGLQILDLAGAQDICAEHDIIYVSTDQESCSIETRAELSKLKWFISGDTNDWAHFV